MNKESQIKKKIKIDGKELQNPLEVINRLALTIGKNFSCSECGEERKIVLSYLQRNLDNLKQVNICQFCLTFKHLEKSIGKEQIEKMREEWESKLKKLKLNPLSVAKYFYENWKITSPVIMQRLIYLTYLEILREKDILLFEEKFQAWPGGPVLESVIYPMYEKHSNIKLFFDKVVSIDNPLVLNYLEKIGKEYSELKSSQICQKARNRLWEEVYNDLEEEESSSINENDLFIFIQASKNQLFSSIQQ